MNEDFMAAMILGGIVAMIIGAGVGATLWFAMGAVMFLGGIHNNKP